MKSLIEILDPSTTTRFYSVEIVEYSEGYRKCFWLRKNAEKYAREHIHEGIMISIRNERTGERIIIKNDWDKIRVYMDLNGVTHIERIK